MSRFLEEKLSALKNNNRLRALHIKDANKIDFCSNDYLGVVKYNLWKFAESNYTHGSTGSRLISGNSRLYIETEKQIAKYHQAQAALVFNSGYDANIGLFSSIASKGDTIIYDEYIHASIRDGIRLSFAFALQFKHNDLLSLEKRLHQASQQGNIFVAVEGVYSMDGDIPHLHEMVELCRKYKAHLIVDEAHSFGVIGNNGEGLVASHGLDADCFARIFTYGKAMGLHGAAVLGSNQLIQYLLNTARSFIYTTAMPEKQIFYIQQAYLQMENLQSERQKLNANILYFKQHAAILPILKSDTCIQGFMINNDENKILDLATSLQNKGLALYPIRYPTVPIGQERIRICLHSFNTKQEIEKLCSAMSYCLNLK